MKWCRVEAPDGASYAELDGEHVELLDAAPFADCRRTGRRYRLDEMKLLPPVIPANFYAAGLNFGSHVEWAKQYHGMTHLKIPDQADIGYRSPSALIGSGADIVVPLDSSGPVEYEGELVAIIGRRAKYLAENDALECVAGYTLGNDLSERAWQKSDRTLWRAKNCDTWKPMGPFITTGLDPMNLTISVKINGENAAEYTTDKMLFSAQHYIAEISRYMTLWPGDVIWLGTDNPTLPDLKHGNVCEIIQEEIGVLRNPVVRASA